MMLFITIAERSSCYSLGSGDTGGNRNMAVSHQVKWNSAGQLFARIEDDYPVSSSFAGFDAEPESPSSWKALMGLITFIAGAHSG